MCNFRNSLFPRHSWTEVEKCGEFFTDMWLPYCYGFESWLWQNFFSLNFAFYFTIFPLLAHCTMSLYACKKFDLNFKDKKNCSFIPASWIQTYFWMILDTYCMVVKQNWNYSQTCRFLNSVCLMWKRKQA